jgi:hypothetical protein
LPVRHGDLSDSHRAQRKSPPLRVPTSHGGAALAAKGRGVIPLLAARGSIPR